MILVRIVLKLKMAEIGRAPSIPAPFSGYQEGHVSCPYRAGWGYKTRFWPVEVGGLGGRRLSIGLAAGEPPERCSACFLPSAVQAGNGSQTAQPQDSSPEERQLSKPPSWSEASGV